VTRFFALASVLLLGCGGGSTDGMDGGPSGAGTASASAPVALAAAHGRDLTATLRFSRDASPVASLPLSEILAKVAPETWTAFDPYYNKPKTWRAVPLADVVRLGFAGAAGLENEDFVLRAKDGFTVPLPGKKVFEAGGYVAFEDVDAPAWEPIGPQRANPGPFYVVWKEEKQQSLETHPRPWQLASIEIARFEATFPHTVPSGVAPDAPAARGFAIFREQCILCHAMNREGGRVGPELNVPKSIVEYRPEPQIKQYIKDPAAFRYGNMPAHPHLGETDLDALVAYFRAMKERKHDPGAGRGAGH
jgi:mono/diheme cytochrome c family protein